MENLPQDHARTPEYLPENDTQPILAWEMPGNIFTRIWLTCWQVLLEPSKSFSRLGKPDYIQPFLFAIIPFVLMQVLRMLADPIIGIKKDPNLDLSNVQVGWAGFLFSNYRTIQFFNLIITPITLAFSLAITAGPLHLFMRLFDACGRPFQATYKVVAYSVAASYYLYTIYSVLLFFVLDRNLIQEQMSQGNLALFFVIWGTGMSMWIWSLIVGIKGLAMLHQTSKGRIFGVAIITALAVALCWFLFGMVILRNIVS